MRKSYVYFASVGVLAACSTNPSGTAVSVDASAGHEDSGAVGSAGITGSGGSVAGSGGDSGTGGVGVTGGGGGSAAGGSMSSAGGAISAGGASGAAGLMSAGASGGGGLSGGGPSGGPKAPQNLTVPPLAFEDTHITVVWEKPLTGTAASYAIYVDGKRTGSVAKIVYPSGDSNQQLFFDITGLTAGTPYTIAVRSLDASGLELGESNLVVQSTTSSPATVAITAAPYNAPNDGSTNATAAIQSAINACAVGGKVLFPAGGRYLSGSLYLKSDCTYQIDGVLVASGKAADYQAGNNRFPAYGTGGKFGTVKYPDNHKALLNTCGSPSTPDNGCTSVRNIRITGSGSIEGNSGLAAAEGGGDARGDLVSLTGVNGLYVARLTFSKSSEHMLFVARSSNITIATVNVQSAGISNADGIDLSTSYADALTDTGPVGLLPTNAYIFGSTWNNGDDCINLNAGSGAPGVAAGTPLDRIHIFNNDTLAGHGGVVYGSFTAAGLKNTWSVENTFNGTNIGFRFKTATGHGGGSATLGPNDVGFIGQDNRANTSVCLEVTNQYGDSTGLPAAGVGTFHDILLSNYTCSGAFNLDTGTNVVVNGKKLR